MMRRAVIELRSPKVKIDIEVELRTKESVAPHKTIDLDPVFSYVELSICMSGHERVGGRWRESVGGQGRDYVLEHFGRDSADGFCEPVRGLCSLWRRWHLNGLCAGNRAQRAFLDNHSQLVEQRYAEVQREAEGYASRFQIESVLLAEHGLDPSDGYTYGSAWLVEPLPEALTERLQRLVTALGSKSRG